MYLLLLFMKGLARDHPESYHSFMWNQFFKHIDILPENAHLLNGNTENLQEECENYEKEISKAGGIELFIGGKIIQKRNKTFNTTLY